MKRAASKTMNWNEELDAQSDRSLVPGLIIAVDLDRFGDYVESRGLDPYKPNIVTGELTRLVEEFAWKHSGVVVYGLSYERGTEEALIEIPYGHEKLDQVVRDLEEMKEVIEKHGVTLSGVVLADYVTGKPAKNRREAYYGTPGRRRAVKLLKSIKRRGGGKIIVLA